jgi:hypothetical protein
MATRAIRSRCNTPRRPHNGNVTPQPDNPLPDDVETLKTMLLAERSARLAEAREQALLIEKLRHQIAKLQSVR